MRYFTVGTKEPKETVAEKLERQLKSAAKGLLLAMREVRSAKTPEDRQYWLFKARRYKAYLERLGKNK